MRTSFLVGGYKDIEDLRAQGKAYQEYLESIRAKLPAATYDFAAANWHYDHTDPRAPHDAWVESLTVEEVARPDHPKQREIAIRVQLLGAHHNGRLHLDYARVRRYEIGRSFANDDVQARVATNQGHGDWLVDEIRLSDAGFVIHEIKFVFGHWIIECEQLSHRWEQFDQEIEPR